MNAVLWNISLALAWVAMNGELTAANFFVGFALGFLILIFARRAKNAPPPQNDALPQKNASRQKNASAQYALKIWRIANLLLFFFKELIVANLRVAFDVLTPGFRMRPALLAVPLDAKTDAEITLLANLITLTPGTISLDVSTDRRTLYIHAMYVDDGEQVKREIKQGFERRVLEVMR